MRSESERDATIRVEIASVSSIATPSSGDPAGPSDFVADSWARTRELLEGLHALVLGRWWAWFWGGLLGLALVVMAVLAVSRGKTPSAVESGPAMVCLLGKTRIADGPSSEWHRARRIPAGVRASTSGPRSRHVVLALAHDSTVRWQGGSRFSWQTGTDGTTTLTIERGRAWVALSSLDGLRLDFPGGRADLSAGTVAELNLRPRSGARLVLRCRQGQVKAQLHQAGRERQVTLFAGQGLTLMPDGHVHGMKQFSPDDGWQRWNLALPSTGSTQ